MDLFVSLFIKLRALGSKRWASPREQFSSAAIDAETNIRGRLTYSLLAVVHSLTPSQVSYHRTSDKLCCVAPRRRLMKVVA